jgi:hypothetical protein
LTERKGCQQKKKKCQSQSWLKQKDKNEDEEEDYSRNEVQRGEKSGL